MTPMDPGPVLSELGLAPRQVRQLHGSMSGSAVFRLELGERSAVLKVTGADGDLTAARRELDVYRKLAADLPVRTPALLDHRAQERRVALLLTAHQAGPPAAAWDTAAWVRLARDLARLHDTRGTGMPGPTWVEDSLRSVCPESLRAFWCRPGEASLLGAVVADAAGLAEAVAASPAGFLHGDCHTENLLGDGDALVWADWQAAGVGSPAVDLAFPSVRAVPHGVRVPVPAMVMAYAAERGTDAATLSAGVLAVELAALVLTWPAYAPGNDAAGVDRVHRRVVELARAWRRA